MNGKWKINNCSEEITFNSTHATLGEGNVIVEYNIMRNDKIKFYIKRTHKCSMIQIEILRALDHTVFYKIKNRKNLELLDRRFDIVLVASKK